MYGVYTSDTIEVHYFIFFGFRCKPAVLMADQEGNADSRQGNEF